MTAERDLDRVWADFGWFLQPDGTRRLLSWNAGTKELKFWSLNRFEKDIVLAVITDEAEVRRRLKGWEDHNTTIDGLAWLAQQLEGCR